ncbi:cytochrome P450 4T8 [Sinocyclocheilus anshuiensis]|uniref:aromatase n=1 Tax=Sinocyclocheilus anshuiensis TaxID=1608454 RepID=A0A671SAI2_9TELE|nr:PREDICTED: cytochrome P450 4B1-like [Sinocyclocheilus anshuiensis]XP_016362229.1 PREDICTED: cytochrome P450 4B1-like [Sinocyclocheilus anshuiensis]
MQLYASFPLSLESLSVKHVFALALLVCLAIVVKLLVMRRRGMRTMEPFPGPPAHWLIGHVKEFRQDGHDLEKIMKWSGQYPFAFPLWFGPSLSILNIHHPSYVKTLLTTTEPKDDYAYKFFIPWLGDGLLVSTGQKWFRHRRLLTPGFHYDVLKPYVKLVSDSTKVMLGKWEVYAKSGESFELFQHASLMTLDSIMKCAFSFNSNCQTDSGTNPYIQAVYDLCHMVNVRFRVFPYHSKAIFHLSPHGYKFRKAARIAHNHTAEVIRKRKEVLKIEKEQGIVKNKRYLDFLDILLSARDEHQQGLSDEDIRAEVDTFMFEGHDTTASGISWIFYNLACNPEHQEKCREEILQVLDGKDTVDWEDLNKIPYTTMCIKESLRLCPPVPGISRKLTKPLTFFDGRTAPEGCTIGVSIYGIHMNASVWENPYVFDPLRFLPENVAERSPHAFVPFSAGPRNCIGQNFAMNEMKVTVALTLKKYRLIKDPQHTPKMIPQVVLRSLNGIHIKIKPVEKDS